MQVQSMGVWLTRSRRCIDLKEGLILYARDSIEERADALWNWRFGLKHHWGAHATEAMLPIHRLMNYHYDEDDGTFET